MPSPEKTAALEARMLSLGITEDTLLEKFIQGSGSGGQKVNKTASCVYLKHSTSGIEVKCQQQRSRELNRYIARRELCERLEVIRDGKKSARKQAQEKIRRQKRRRSRRAKNRMLDDKSKHSQKKNLRKDPGSND
jgi:protein subunit release factor B